jgi:surface polysaccharide O-acyltransferase-like enzyme
MHFLPTLFCLVLFFPLYRKAADALWTALVIIVCLLAKREADSWFWANGQHLAGFDYIVRALKVLAYVGYGYVAAALYGIWRSGKLRNYAGSWLSVIAAALLSLYIIKLVYSARVVTSGNWQYGYTPAYWADFLTPVLLFALFMMCAHRKWPAFWSELAPYSFGLYLCHPMFMDLIEILIVDMSISPSGQVAAKFLGSLLCASTLVWVLSRTSWLAWTIGLGELPKISFLSITKIREVTQYVRR